MFQFHNGSIKRDDEVNIVIYQPSFNSTMVRLKGISTAFIEKDSYQFQFHNGSIKSLSNMQQAEKPNAFQFHNGSIKSEPEKEISMRVDFVSIPQWFD